MYHCVPLADQLAAAAADRLRVLVVGAGIAGTTFAGLLRRDGLQPVLVERRPPGADEGYMLALMPLVDPVLDALGAGDRYRHRSTALRTYVARGRRGTVLRADPLAELLDRHGDYRGIARGPLLDVLSGDGLPVSHSTTLEAVREDDDGAHVTLVESGIRHEATVDLVVAADGLGSASGQLALGDAGGVGGAGGVDTGWGGWIAWTGPGLPADRGEEVWGTGFFLAAYPVEGDTGVILGGPRPATAVGHRQFVARVRAQLRRPRGVVGAGLDAVAADPDPYYWSLRDRRSDRWHAGRVVLLGDAAAGFLPTAGIGAAMAIESAGVLADRLHGATPADLAQILAGYERAQRPRVESAQSNSRSLARLMFLRSPVLAAVRDQVARRVSLDRALRPILTLLTERPRYLTPGR